MSATEDWGTFRHFEYERSSLLVFGLTPQTKHNAMHVRQNNAKHATNAMQYEHANSMQCNAT